MVAPKCVLLIYTLFLTLFSVHCHNFCITNDLEGGFEEQFSECAHTRMNPWYPGTYRSFGLDPPHPNSTSFIVALGSSATTTSSCVSNSKPLTVIPGSMIQVYFYANVSDSYALYIVLFDADSSAFVTSGGRTTNTHSNGWGDMYVRVPSTYNGGSVYIVFEVDIRNSWPAGSNVLIDSYHYVSQTNQLKNCKIYPDIVDTEITTTVQPDSTEEVTVTEKSDNSGESTTTEQPNSSEESTNTEEPDISEEDTDLQPVDPEGGTDSDEEIDMDHGNPSRCINNCVCNCHCR